MNRSSTRCSSHKEGTLSMNKYFSRAIGKMLATALLATLAACGGGGGEVVVVPVSYITWLNSVNGELVADANGDFVRFRSDTRNMVFGNTEYSNLRVTTSGAQLVFNGAVVGSVAYIKSVTGSTITGLLCSDGTYMDIFGDQSNLNIKCTSVVPIPA